MAKQIVAKIKLQCPGGQATPAPPVGPALGQHGVPIKQFVDRFNADTKDKIGFIIPVEISVYADKSFDYILKSPPAAVLLKKAAGIAKGSGTVGTEIVATVTRAQVEDIANTKMEDLGAASLDAACRMIAGTARSMGITVEGM